MTGRRTGYPPRGHHWWQRITPYAALIAVLATAFIISVVGLAAMGSDGFADTFSHMLVTRSPGEP